MSDAERLLELIEESIVKQGGDLGGSTRRGEGTLDLFDGRVTLWAELHEKKPRQENAVHAHVLTTLHGFDGEVLDACLRGMGHSREAAIAEATAATVEARHQAGIDVTANRIVVADLRTLKAYVLGK